MATRSRTLLFLQYRNSYARTQISAPHFTSGNSETEGLIESSDNVIEMSALPPKWVDIVDEVDDALDAIKGKISQLEGMHRKHLLPGFDDRSSDEEAIERMTSEITSEFYRIKRDIQRIEPENQQGEQDVALAKNIQISLATKVQELSSSFRKQQSSYLKKIQGQENKKANILGLESDLSNEAADLLLDEDAQVGFTESQLAVLESNEAVIDQREREVNQIAKSIHQLAEIFRDLQTLVIDQGTLLDRIDFNIEQTNIQVKHAVVELDKGSRYQRKTRNRKIMLLLILLIMLLIVILIVKPKKH
ncbi:t-SNARE [Radiomyces spectabilis]|uniref:t-SNARE n=1 Tax=Radiomyces spectabilis TaxID=64574 RepID=UPI00221FF013|nr:t-SNARE [Radiomyces spectabilis]KAI8374248.1 t-SNARE [Radiomyces spectabilis]